MNVQKCSKQRRRRRRRCRRSAINLQIPVAVLLWHATSFLAVELVALTGDFSATLGAGHVKQTSNATWTCWWQGQAKNPEVRNVIYTTKEQILCIEERDREQALRLMQPGKRCFLSPLSLPHPPPSTFQCDSLVYMHSAVSAHLYLCKYLSLSNYLQLYL